MWCRVSSSGDLSLSPVRSALRQVRSSRSFEVVQAGFLPPTAGRFLIGGTSSYFGPLLRVTALLSDLRAGDCGLPLLRMGHARVWVVACPPLLRERRAATTLVPLMPCASAGISFWSFLASSRFSLSWGFGGLVQVFSCLALLVPVRGLSDFSPADFSSLRLCLVDRIKLGYFLGGSDWARGSFPFLVVGTGVPVVPFLLFSAILRSTGCDGLHSSKKH